MTIHETAHLRNLIAANRRANDPLVMIRVDELEKLVDAWELMQLSKTRVRVPARPLAPEEYRDDFITRRFETVS